MTRQFLCKVFVFMLFLFGTALSVQSQDLFKGRDLSQVKVGQLSDADIVKLKTQLASNGMSIEQAEQVALQKGMSASEFAKLKQRLLAIDKKDASATGKLAIKAEKPVQGRSSNSPDTLDTRENTKRNKPLINPLIFGSELYTSVAPSFEPNLNLATPYNYILGPSDVIQISVYGVQQFEGELTVSTEGDISIPNVGQIRVSGLTIEAATEKIRTAMGNLGYPYLKTGGSKLSVSLGRIRSIKVTVIGSNEPGNFTVSSLATVFNVLYLAGGPSEFGSFREIELIRNNKPIRKIDLYRLLLNGDQSDNVGLKDNDVIRIPSYKVRAELQGQVKRPGIFEVLPGETFSNILAFASGFTDTAYQAAVKVFHRDAKERQVFDMAAANFGTFKPESGDVFYISKLLDRFQNRVKITGAVFRPDVYQLTPSLTVADLIRRADGLKEDAFTPRGQIIRLQEDLTRSIISFDIRKALAGDEPNNPLLKREDEVLISSVMDLRDTVKVTIQGEVRNPGPYEYIDKLTLKDLILQAGGFTDAANKNIEIARLIKRDSLSFVDVRGSEIINTEVNGDLTTTSNIFLQPFDVITIRRKAGYTLPESVKVTGQVQYPGPYAISSRNERVSDILRRAGGYTSDAYLQGAYLKRYKSDEEKQKLEVVAKKIQQNFKDTSQAIIEEVKRDYDQIPLDLVEILRSPGSIEDLTIKSRDELFIPKFDGQVKVSGSVLLVTQIPYDEKNSFRDYISSAGGFNANAWRGKAYLVYANGKAATTKHFLFFKKYPKVEPGSEIIVPKKEEKKGASTGEIIGISSALASLAGVVIALLRL